MLYHGDRERIRNPGTFGNVPLILREGRSVELVVYREAGPVLFTSSC